MDETYDTELIGGPGDGKRMVLHTSMLSPGPLGKVKTLRLLSFDTTKLLREMTPEQMREPVKQKTHLYEISVNPADEGALWIGTYKGIEEIRVD